MAPSRVEMPADEDSVRAYYRKLARVALLTRAGEIALAQRIERAESRVVKALVASPLAVQELCAIGGELVAAKLRARDITRNPADDEDEEVARAHVLELLEPVQQLGRLTSTKVRGVAAKLARARKALEQLRMTRSVLSRVTGAIRRGARRGRDRRVLEGALASVRDGERKPMGRRRTSSRPTCGSWSRSPKSTLGKACNWPI